MHNIRFVGLVVMTLALHARGPQFNPGTKYACVFQFAIVYWFSDSQVGALVSLPEWLRGQT